jgi:predicted DCC family thiol-disulfide oxidoreductase YuxK
MGANSEIDSLKFVVLYDGVCNFCNSSVNFIIKHERDIKLCFASLQSDFGRKILDENNLNTSEFDSIVFVDSGKIFVKSKAALKIAGHLKLPWRIAVIFEVLPSFFTDFCYDLVAKHRYQIFGRTDSCVIPSKELRTRFL